MYTHHHNHFWGLFSSPHKEWQRIREENLNILKFAVARLLYYALVPTIAFFWGLSFIGWSFSGTTFNVLSWSHTIPMAGAFYLMIIVVTTFMALFTFWTEKSICSTAQFDRSLLFVTYAATPMYMAGLIGLIPIVWLCLLILVPAVTYSLYLLYIGVPIYMKIHHGKAFVVTISVITAGLCALVAFNVATVIIWSKVAI